MKIRIPKPQQEECKEFAEKYANSRHDIYATRGQRNLQTITDQAYWSKLAEIAVEIAITKLGVLVTEEVDLSIHTRHQTRYDADIKTTNARCHVKSVKSDRLEKSWGFQKDDPVVFEPEEDEILVFCVTHVKRNELDYVEIVGACRATEALEFYDRPRNQALSETKEFLYFENPPNKPEVPELKKILKPLARVLKSLPENRVSYTNKSRREMEACVWKEF